MTILYKPSTLEDRDIMTVFVAQGALLGIYGTSFIDTAFLDAAGAALFEA